MAISAAFLYSLAVVLGVEGGSLLLGLAIPLVVAVSTSLGAKGGLLIRDRSAFERSRRIDAMVFDKTGTLTEGVFGVDRVWTFSDRGEDEVLALAAFLESRSEHPIAQGIVRSAEARALRFPALEESSSKGAALMSASTIIVAANAQLPRTKRHSSARQDPVTPTAGSPDVGQI